MSFIEQSQDGESIGEAQDFAGWSKLFRALSSSTVQCLRYLYGLVPQSAFVGSSIEADEAARLLRLKRRPLMSMLYSLLFAACVLESIAAPEPAIAQVAESNPAPESPVLDPNGVDLVSGMPVLKRKEIGIGAGDSSIQRVFNFYFSSDNNAGKLQSLAPTPPGPYYIFLSYNGESTVFNENSDGTYTDAEGRGNTLTYNSSASTFTFTDRYGTVALFKVLSTGNTAFVTSITKRTGEVTNFYYNASQNAYFPLNSIVNSSGYGFFNTVPAAGSFTAISAINLNRQYCAPNSTQCTPASAATGTQYTYSDSQTTTQTGPFSDQTWTNSEDIKATSALLRTTTYHRETDGETVAGSPAWTRYQAHLDVVPPVGATTTYTFGNYDSSQTGAGDISNRIVQVKRGSLTWTYSWQYTGLQHPWANSLTVGYPGQGSRVLTFSVAIVPWGVRITQDSFRLADGTARTTAYEYDSYGRTTKVTNPELDSVAYTYDSRGNITSLTKTPKPGSTLAPEVTTFGYDTTCANIATCNKPNYRIDPKNNRTDYTYDPVHGGILTETLPPDSNGVRPQTRYFYSQLHSLIMSSTGQLVSGPAVWKLTSKSECRTTSSCTGTADEIVTQYTYDANLQPTGLTVAAGDGSAQTSSLKTYDAIGNVAQVQGPFGSTDATRSTYDADRELIFSASPDPDGAGGLGVVASKHGYDPNGHETSVQSGYAADQSDASLNAMTVTKTVTRTYDALERLSSEQVLTGSTPVTATQYSYGTDGRLECKAVRMNPAVFGSLPSSACSLGAAGSDGSDRITRTTYDAANEVLQIQAGYGTPIQENHATYTYSPNGKRTSVTDANGNLATMTYDGFDRLSRWTFPSKTTPGQVNSTDFEAYAYDANDNQTQLTKRDGRTINYAFDALDRVISKCASSTGACTSPNATTGRDVFYKYDLQGHQLAATFDSSTGAEGVTNGYDVFGNLKSSSLTAGTGASALTKGVSSIYDPAGNRTQVTQPEGQVYTYAFDLLNRVSGIYLGAGTSTPLHTFSYNNDGTLASRAEPQTSSGVAYGWDGIGRLTSQSDTLSTNSVSWSFTNNAASEISSENRNNDTYRYGGLLSVNRQYAVNGLNQYTSAGSASFTYDLNGNLISDGTNSYSYDIYNRLISMASNSGSVTLTYDPLGRLTEVLKRIGSTVSSDTKFVYDGEALIAEYDGLNSNNPIARYVHGTNAAIDDPLVSWQLSSGTWQRYFLHADHEGSIVARQPDAGPVQINSYDEYGIPAGSNTGRFQYTGQIWLRELGMYYFKARMYSPTLGRFMQTDPVGYKDQINLYEYVGDDPIDRNDPSGMCQGPSGGECDHQKDSRVALLAPAATTAATAAGETAAGATAATAAAVAPALLLSGDQAHFSERVYVTYTKVNAKTGEVYSGRASMDVPEGTPITLQLGLRIVARREAGHHMNERGFGPARLDRVSDNYSAIRGREQQLINHFGGAKSIGGTSGNAINGISIYNPARSMWLKESTAAFGYLKNNSSYPEGFFP